MQIPQNIIDEITNRADIVDIIGKSLKIKRQGSNYFACCPFHKEKSPSFSINPLKQMYHCFGCAESGNVISFVMKYNGWEFIDSIKYLATLTGVTIPSDGPQLSIGQIKQQKERKLGLIESINKTVLFYRKNLSGNITAKNYLVNRGVRLILANISLSGSLVAIFCETVFFLTELKLSVSLSLLSETDKFDTV